MGTLIHNIMKKFAILIFVIALITPLTYANGGCVKVADNILVQMSMAPLVPTVNGQTSFLFSFADLNSNPISKEIKGQILIFKNKEHHFMEGFSTQDGVADFKHIFSEAGIYEVYVEFKLNGIIYNPEDFRIEVKGENQDMRLNNFASNMLFLVIGLAIGFFASKLYKKQKLQKTKN